MGFKVCLRLGSKKVAGGPQLWYVRCSITCAYLPILTFAEVGRWPKFARDPMYWTKRSYRFSCLMKFLKPETNFSHWGLCVKMLDVKLKGWIGNRYVYVLRLCLLSAISVRILRLPAEACIWWGCIAASAESVNAQENYPFTIEFFKFICNKLNRYYMLWRDQALLVSYSFPTNKNKYK